MKNRARALMDLQPYAVKCGQVLEAPHQLINALAESGDVDPHPDAVAYAIAAGAFVVPFGTDSELATPAQEKRTRKPKPSASE